ncbi:restriction endonuclease subunit S [Hydrogenophaga bisanensis]|uniref:Restriction endonuclease subunit S n=1 Tax=Hydrogenophaga bisanensis TaxID=439611 RepID=A0ABW2R3T9_9BURK
MVEERPQRSESDVLVWNLNLDQIEPDTGRVLERVRIPQFDLGPSTYPFAAGTVLYSKLRPYLNKVVVADEPGFATTELVPLRCMPQKAVPSYIAYFLRSAEFLSFANTVVAGAKMPRMVMSEFWKYQVPLPPIHEQRRIAAILDKADALRTKRREALVQLDRLAQSIFLEMFGDPSANPKGWERRRLDELVVEGDSINYGVVQPGEDVENGVPLVRVSDLVAGEVQHDALKRIAPQVELAYQRSRLKGDEILVSCVGSVGVVALASQRERGFNIARAVARIRIGERADREFIAAQLGTRAVQRYFTQELRTVSQPTLNIKQICETQLICPPLELQREFAHRVRAVREVKARLAESESQTKALFQSVQHRAFHEAL